MVQMGGARWRKGIAYPFCLGGALSRWVVVMSDCYEHFECIGSLDKHSSNHLYICFQEGDSPSKEWGLDEATVLLSCP